jgi:hypothetical protein
MVWSCAVSGKTWVTSDLGLAREIRFVRIRVCLALIEFGGPIALAGRDIAHWHCLERVCTPPCLAFGAATRHQQWLRRMPGCELAGVLRTYKTLPSGLNPFNPNGTFSQEAIAIGQSAHGIITGNWAQVAVAADNMPLGMTR